MLVAALSSTISTGAAASALKRSINARVWSGWRHLIVRRPWRSPLITTATNWRLAASMATTARSPAMCWLKSALIRGGGEAVGVSMCGRYTLRQPRGHPWLAEAECHLGPPRHQPPGKQPRRSRRPGRSCLRRAPEPGAPRLVPPIGARPLGIALTGEPFAALVLSSPGGRANPRADLTIGR